METSASVFGGGGGGGGCGGSGGGSGSGAYHCQSADYGFYAVGLGAHAHTGFQALEYSHRQQEHQQPQHQQQAADFAANDPSDGGEQYPHSLFGWSGDGQQYTHTTNEAGQQHFSATDADELQQYGCCDEQQDWIASFFLNDPSGAMGLVVPYGGEVTRRQGDLYTTALAQTRTADSFLSDMHHQTDDGCGHLAGFSRVVIPFGDEIAALTDGCRTVRTGSSPVTPASLLDTPPPSWGSSSSPQPLLPPMTAVFDLASRSTTVAATAPRRHRPDHHPAVPPRRRRAASEATTTSSSDSQRESGTTKPSKTKTKASSTTTTTTTSSGRPKRAPRPPGSNRDAAKKSREKQRDQEQALIRSERERAALNDRLRAELGQAVREVNEWRGRLLGHAHCSNANINNWIRCRADVISKSVASSPVPQTPQVPPHAPMSRKMLPIHEEPETGRFNFRLQAPLPVGEGRSVA